MHLSGIDDGIHAGLQAGTHAVGPHILGPKKAGGHGGNGEGGRGHPADNGSVWGVTSSIVGCCLTADVTCCAKISLFSFMMIRLLSFFNFVFVTFHK
ncbi:hypothetical protein HZA75_07475 [Candidatus Roizmanbacteria bacterium]|nr:hypothetical protein [Candidatus Roizmanbacteria bacterium]